MLATARQASRRLAALARQFHSSGTTRGGGHGGYVSFCHSRFQFVFLHNLFFLKVVATQVLLFISSTIWVSAPQDDYVHAPNMYNITAMKSRKLKFGLGVAGVVGGGAAIPWVGRVKWCTVPKIRGNVC